MCFVLIHIGFCCCLLILLVARVAGSPSGRLAIIKICVGRKAYHLTFLTGAIYLYTWPCHVNENFISFFSLLTLLFGIKG